MNTASNKKNLPSPYKSILTLSVLFCFSCSNQGSITGGLTSAKTRNASSISQSAFSIPTDGEQHRDIKSMERLGLRQDAIRQLDRQPESLSAANQT